MPNVDFGEPSTSSLLTPQHDGQPSGEKTEGKKNRHGGLLTSCTKMYQDLNEISVDTCQFRDMYIKKLLIEHAPIFHLF